MKKTIIRLVILIVLIFLILFLSVLITSYLKERMTKQTAEETSSQNDVGQYLKDSIEKEFESSQNINTNWQTYENKELGFGFKYPVTMTVKNIGGSQLELQKDGNTIIGINSWLCPAEKPLGTEQPFEDAAKDCYLNSIMGFQNISKLNKEYLNNDKNNVYSEYELNVLSGPLGHEKAIQDEIRIDFLLGEEKVYQESDYNILFLELKDNSQNEVFKAIGTTLHKL